MERMKDLQKQYDDLLLWSESIINGRGTVSEKSLDASEWFRECRRIEREREQINNEILAFEKEVSELDGSQFRK